LLRRLRQVKKKKTEVIPEVEVTKSSEDIVVPAEPPKEPVVKQIIEQVQCERCGKHMTPRALTYTHHKVWFDQQPIEVDAPAKEASLHEKLMSALKVPKAINPRAVRNKQRHQHFDTLFAHAV
jgi:hypothetical protein